MIAFAWRDGSIGVGETVPDGALPFAEYEGLSAEKLREMVAVKARHSYDDTLLVPGVPEAGDDSYRAADALKEWAAWAFPQGFETAMERM